MTKTDKKYFDTLKGDMINATFNAILNDMSVENYEHFCTMGKQWKEHVEPYFNRPIRNYERGLITREECFHCFLIAYDEILKNETV